MPDVNCPMCNGYGYIEFLEYVTDSEGRILKVKELMTCQQCNGSGKIEIEVR